jgi:hypothetical protein
MANCRRWAPVDENIGRSLEDGPGAAGFITLSSRGFPANKYIWAAADNDGAGRGTLRARVG